MDAALERPKLAAHYDEGADVFEIAALYAHAIAKRHPFVDGNKRVAFSTALTFLMLNGQKLVADLDERYDKMYGLASGELTETEFAEWLRGVTAPTK